VKAGLNINASENDFGAGSRSSTVSHVIFPGHLRPLSSNWLKYIFTIEDAFGGAASSNGPTWRDPWGWHSLLCLWLTRV
jgi:hypothetical protein